VRVVNQRLWLRRESGVILHLGDSGPLVGGAQQALVESVYSPGLEEIGRGYFGYGTQDAIRAFQAAHVGPDGHALVSDGVIGPSTMWSLQHPGGGGQRYTSPSWRCSPSDTPEVVRPVIQWAFDHIGVHEEPDGSNRGSEIDQWTGMVGQPTNISGPAWCAYFLSAAYTQTEGGSPFDTLASAYKIKEWGRRTKKIVNGLLQPGDVWIILRGDLHGHVGLVGTVLDISSVATIEGNSGNAVRGLVRMTNTFSCVVRPVLA